MLFDIASSIAILAFFSSLGLGVDKLVTQHQKSKLSGMMLEFWVLVEALKIPDLPILAAKGYVSFHCRIAGNKILSFRYAATSLLVSVIFTSIAFAVGQFLGFYLTHHYYLIAGIDCDQACMSNIPSNRELLEATWWAFSTHAQKLIMYLGNFIFDLMTIATTFLMISVVSRVKSGIARVFLILLDLAIASLIFLTALYVLYHANSLYSIPGEWFSISYFFDLVKEKIGIGPGNNFFPFWVIPQLAFTSTIFYPTFAFLIILLLVTLAHVFAVLIKLSGLQLFELSSEGKHTIFFYSGTFIGLVASAMTLSLKLTV